ncbi:MAG TPA: radical SAM family heme chaperone HemW [Thermoanaerobaculia bacterium]|nr:radical SAM family heme chaperone HemW [Thermoanaerobaculia bacterium]
MAQAGAVARPGLYVHVPFCSAICPYCDFSVLPGDPARKGRFVADLIAEARLWEGAWDEPFDTLYLGGGTPSSLAPEQLARILEALRHYLPIAASCRLSMEANPEDVDAAAVAAWRALGVHTLSLGVQSFDAAALRFLGRRHTPAQSRRSVELAREAGFPVVSLDLIYALPGQSQEDWRRQLAAALELAPPHLSCYELTIHQGTPFGFRVARGALSPAPEGARAALFHLTHDVLADRGLAAYEVSSFAAAPEFRSRHNAKYWRHVPYLGLGPSAHSFDGSRRWWNERKLGPWQQRVARGERPVAGSESLHPTDLALEALFLGFRTTDGVDLAAIRQRWGLDLAAANGDTIAALAADGLLRRAGTWLVPTAAGLAVADSLAARFEMTSPPGRASMMPA